MKTTSIVALFLFLTIVDISAQEDLISTYAEYYAQVNQLEKEEHYQEAIQLTQRIWNKFPEREFDLIKEMIYLNEKTKQYEKNLELWEAGHQKGLFFLLSPRIKKYEPYLQYSQFDELVKKDETLRQVALENSKTIFEVVIPAEYNQAKKYPLILIFHGGGSSIGRARDSWRIIPLLEIDFIIVYLQSYRRVDSNTFGWKSGDERTHQELKECFDDITNRYSVDRSQVYLSGISAGATMALDVAFSKTIPVQGIIAFCPGIPGNFGAGSILTTFPKVYMLAGENDFYLPKQKELVDIFEKTGFNYSYKIIPGMGHEFPDDYEQIMNESLSYIQQ